MNNEASTSFDPSNFDYSQMEPNRTKTPPGRKNEHHQNVFLCFSGSKKNFFTVPSTKIVQKSRRNDAVERCRKRWSWMAQLFLLLFTICSLPAVAAQREINNSVVGEPFISCATDAIYAKWKTNTTFTGHVNVRYAPNRLCFQMLVTNNQIELLVPHLECQVNRIRSVNPAGVIMETTVLISFHPQFVTAGDRIYHLKCLHSRDPKKNGTTEGALVMPKGIPFTDLNSTVFTDDTTAAAVNGTNDGRSLQCGYSVVDADGTLVDTVEVGDEVQHKWWCRHAPANQCLIVTNCVLKTFDAQFDLVDARGCSRDLSILPQLEYAHATEIQAKIRVFGVPQRPFLHFQCQMNLVQRLPNGGCPRPECPTTNGDSGRAKRDLGGFLIDATTESFDALSQELEIVQPGAKRKPTNPDCLLEGTSIEQVLPEGTVCVSKVAFALVSGATITVAIITLGVVLFFMLRRFQYSDVPSSD